MYKQICQYLIDVAVTIILVCFFYLISGKTILGLIFGVVWVAVDQIRGLKRKNEELASYIQQLNESIFNPDELKNQKKMSQEFDYLLSAMKSGGVKLGLSATQILECFKEHGIKNYDLERLSEGESFKLPSGETFNASDEHKIWFIGYGSLLPPPTIAMVFKHQKLVDIQPIKNINAVIIHMIKQCKKNA